ncbi:MAG: hypothetical protein AAGJ35_07165, partial [Myxococcota bacterium]
MREPIETTLRRCRTQFERGGSFEDIGTYIIRLAEIVLLDLLLDNDLSRWEHIVREHCQLPFPQHNRLTAPEILFHRAMLGLIFERDVSEQLEAGWDAIPEAWSYATGHAQKSAVTSSAMALAALRGDADSFDHWCSLRQAYVPNNKIELEMMFCMKPESIPGLPTCLGTYACAGGGNHYPRALCIAHKQAQLQNKQRKAKRKAD